MTGLDDLHRRSVDIRARRGRVGCQAGTGGCEINRAVHGTACAFGACAIVGESVLVGHLGFSRNFTKHPALFLWLS